MEDQRETSQTVAEAEAAHTEAVVDFPAEATTTAIAARVWNFRSSSMTPNKECHSDPGRKIEILDQKQKGIWNPRLISNWVKNKFSLVTTNRHRDIRRENGQQYSNRSYYNNQV